MSVSLILPGPRWASLCLALFVLTMVSLNLALASAIRPVQAFEAPPLAEPAGGVIGATCRSEPICPHCPGTSGNVCRKVPDIFYPGLTMVLARAATVKRCQEANALDYCGTSCSFDEREKHQSRYQGGCYEQCASKTTCLYVDNR